MLVVNLALQAKLPGLTIHAGDVNDRSIQYLQSAYPTVESYTSAFSPPLKYPDLNFDLIYSVSIFSHLNIRDHELWLRESGKNHTRRRTLLLDDLGNVRKSASFETVIRPSRF